jgi:hypothetical protein
MQWKRLETDNGYVYSEVFDLIPTWGDWGVGELGCHEHSSESARTCLRAISRWNWNRSIDST